MARYIVDDEVFRYLRKSHRKLEDFTPVEAFFNLARVGEPFAVFDVLIKNAKARTFAKKWAKDNCKHAVLDFDTRLYFWNSSEAMLFKLTMETPNNGSSE